MSRTDFFNSHSPFHSLPRGPQNYSRFTPELRLARSRLLVSVETRGSAYVLRIRFLPTSYSDLQTAHGNTILSAFSVGHAAPSVEELQRNRVHTYRLARIGVSIIAVLFLTCAAIAQNYTAPSTPVIGSVNTVTANAPVPHPAIQPCTVTLFQNFDFADSSPKLFSYAPPVGCLGPWAAVRSYERNMARRS